ncbi:hypothetical protein VULLAG_LOCUS17689 [Vulpes lagopus]
MAFQGVLRLRLGVHGGKPYGPPAVRPVSPGLHFGSLRSVHGKMKTHGVVGAETEPLVSVPHSLAGICSMSSSLWHSD